jgi:hypothetical protein
MIGFETGAFDVAKLILKSYNNVVFNKKQLHICLRMIQTNGLLNWWWHNANA